MLVNIAVLVIGVIILAKSADQFVLGAARLAKKLHISAVVVGVVVIGFGTSLPEMLVSGLAVADGQQGIAVGNIVGSNVANMTLVLGAAAVFGSLKIASSTLRREAPLSVAAVIGLALLLQGGLSRLEGIVLVIALIASLSWVVLAGRDDKVLGDEVEEFLDGGIHLRVEVFRTLIGLIGTVVAAQALVWSATRIAEELGLTGGFIGFTLVAIGTSLPELVTALSAARRGEADLVIGNLLGSNLFNSLAIGGLIALVAPGPIADRSLTVTGSILMVVAAVGAWMLMITASRIDRWEAIVLLAFYAVAVGVMAGGSVEDSAGPTTISVSTVSQVSRLQPCAACEREGVLHGTSHQEDERCVEPGSSLADTAPRPPRTTCSTTPGSGATMTAVVSRPDGRVRS